MKSRAPLLERVRFLLSGRKENPVGSMMVQTRVGQAVWTDANFANLAREGYQTNVYVYRAIRLLSASIGGLRWIITATDTQGNETEREGHPLLSLLKRPNPFQGQAQFFEAVVSFLAIAGNSYITPAIGGGRVIEMWPLRPDRMKVLAGPGPWLPVGGYEYRVESGTTPRRFEPEEILHLRRFHPTNDFYGLAPLVPSARSIDSNNDARRHNVALLQNGASPGGMVSVKQPMTEPNRAEFLKQFEDDHTGPSNAGKLFLGEGDVSYTQMGLSPKDMDWLEGSRLSAREIVNAIGVPPEMVGDTANKTFNSYPEARRAFYQDTVLPEADYFKDELTYFFRRIKALRENESLDYDKDAIEALREDRATLWTAAGEAWKDGRLTRNESRVAMSYDEEPGGDFYLLPLGVTPVNADGSDLFPPEDVPDIPPADDEDPGEIPDEDPQEPPDEDEDEKRRARTWETKAFNLGTPERRLRHFKAMDRRREKWIKSIRAAAAKRLGVQRKQIVAAVAGASDPSGAVASVEKAIVEQHEAWGRFYTNVYQAVGKDFADGILRGLKSDLRADWTFGGPSCRKALDAFRVKADRDTDGLVQQAIDNYLRSTAGQKIKGILDTDLDRIREQLAEGVRAGEGADVLAKRIDGYLLEIYPNRAETVARTEVIGASNAGSQAGAIATGLPIRKSWLATPGSRTRASHLDANGQTVPLDQPYIVGASRMGFPGDSRLGADVAEIANCRCTETYDVQGEP